MFTIHLGPRRVVVLYGYDAVKEALEDNAEEFSGRGEQATFNTLFKGYGEEDLKSVIVDRLFFFFFFFETGFLCVALAVLELTL